MPTPTAGKRKQQDIRDMMAAKRQRVVTAQPARTHNHEGTRPTSTDAPERDFAHQLFFRHTNIAQILAEDLPDRSEDTRKRRAEYLYTVYRKHPVKRLFKELHRIRFDTHYHEGLWQMATKIPFQTEQQFESHRQTLAAAGVTNLCFVDMTSNNLVMEHIQRMLKRFKREGGSWNKKLVKFQNYIMEYQRKWEKHADQTERLGNILKTSSNLSTVHPNIIPEVFQQIVQELQVPAQHRWSFLLQDLRFTHDSLNRKYEVGVYADAGRSICSWNNDIMTQHNQKRGKESTKQTPREDESDSSASFPPNQQENTDVILDVIEILDSPPLNRVSSNTAGSMGNQGQKQSPGSENIAPNLQAPITRPPERVVTTKSDTPSNVTCVVAVSNSNENTVQDKTGLENIAQNQQAPIASSPDRVVTTRSDTPSDVICIVDSPVLSEPSGSSGAMYFSSCEFFASPQQDQRQTESPGPAISSTTILPPNEQPIATPERVFPKARRARGKIKRFTSRAKSIIYEDSPVPVQHTGPSFTERTLAKTIIFEESPVPVQHTGPSFTETTLAETIIFEESPVPIQHTRPSFAEKSRKTTGSQSFDQSCLTPTLMPIPTSSQQHVEPNELNSGQTKTERQNQDQPVELNDPSEEHNQSIAFVPTTEQPYSQISQSTNHDPLELLSGDTTIAPFQTEDTCANVSLSSIVEFGVKTELSDSQLSTGDSSGYEGHVEVIGSPPDTAIVIDDDDEENFTFNEKDDGIDAIQAYIKEMLEHSSAPKASGPAPDSDGSAICLNDESSSIDVPRIGEFITIVSERGLIRKPPESISFSLATTNNTTEANILTQNRYFEYLPRIHIESIRYNERPTCWSEAINHSKLTVTAHHAKLYSVTAHDHDAFALFGLDPRDNGSSALRAALVHVRKFRHDSREPPKSYYGMKLAERVLHLFFRSLPECFVDGGIMMLFNNKSGFVAEENVVSFERFNYHLHSKCSPTSATSERGGEELVNVLMPGIARKMQELKERLNATEDNLH